MKKILILVFVIFVSFNSLAQNGSRERMKAYKVAYLTEKLNLTSKEAEKFWPIYNTYEETVHKLKRQERKQLKALREASDGPDGLSDQQAGDFLNNHIENQEKKSRFRKKLITDLKQTISNKKIITLIKAEADFNKRILQRMRERRKKG
ncbi:hypothetical protein [Aquimarina algiphila]|uniref:hypothetical protein n=1 Tax=Aquimarina algiphila TaxID=2047982 RepID=UPI00232DA0E0|nr:hypothetical protein [Aquimarina algiphila]